MPYHSAQRSSRSELSNRSTASVIPIRTAVEVFDEEDQQWYRGGHVAFYHPENNQYTILWGNGETTTAEALFVRKLKLDWTRVRHPSGFRLNAKRAPYKDWLETQPAPPPAPERIENPEEPDRESQVSAEPWIVPSRRPGPFPELYEEPADLPPKRTPQWRRNISKYFKKQNQIAEERPRFTVPARRHSDWNSWKTAMPELPAKKENSAIKKYWGRFAPEEAFAADEPAQDYQQGGRPSQVHVDPTKNTASKTPPKKESPSAEKPAKKSPKATPQSVPPPATSPAKPASANGDVTSPTAMSKFVPRHGERMRLPTSDHTDDIAAREELLTRLAGEKTPATVSASTISASLLSELGRSNMYAGGVTPALAAAKHGSGGARDVLTRTEFRTVLVSLERYIELHDLYGNPKRTETPEIEPEAFEKAIPLLSKWGIGMDDIEKQFVVDTESSITFDEFFGWAVQQNITH
ncbi:Flagellar calcium-binding protein [Diplonema papillatum]|nr:Flagellar calcium-binding protein [Diplonema papillatum]|eukprot:gene11172-17176_t